MRQVNDWVIIIKIKSFVIRTKPFDCISIFKKKIVEQFFYLFFAHQRKRLASYFIKLIFKISIDSTLIHFLNQSTFPPSQTPSTTNNNKQTKRPVFSETPTTIAMPKQYQLQYRLPHRAFSILRFTTTTNKASNPQRGTSTLQSKLQQFKRAQLLAGVRAVRTRRPRTLRAPISKRKKRQTDSKTKLLSSGNRRAYPCASNAPDFDRFRSKIAKKSARDTCKVRVDIRKVGGPSRCEFVQFLT